MCEPGELALDVTAGPLHDFRPGLLNRNLLLYNCLKFTVAHGVERGQAKVEALQKRVGDVESGVSEARDALRPDAIRVRALEAAHGILESAQSVVDGQLAEVSAPKKPAPKAPPKRAPRKATPASRKVDGDAPIRNYDKLTAKDVVARIQRLSPPQASALLDYEQGRKNRATVVRAAKQRAAAG